MWCFNVELCRESDSDHEKARIPRGRRRARGQEQVSGQRFYPNSSGQPQDFCDFSPGLPLYTATVHSGRNERGSCLAFLKHSWLETFWLLTKLSPEVNSGDAVSPTPKLWPFATCLPTSLQTWGQYLLSCLHFDLSSYGSLISAPVRENAQRRAKGDLKMNLNNPRERKRKTQAVGSNSSKVSRGNAKNNFFGVLRGWRKDSQKLQENRRLHKQPGDTGKNQTLVSTLKEEWPKRPSGCCFQRPDSGITLSSDFGNYF